MTQLTLQQVAQLSDRQLRELQEQNRGTQQEIVIDHEIRLRSLTSKLQPLTRDHLDRTDGGSA